jgi:CDP-6-deoxy-D-xylo-4-hexulose-3-dehydrase
LKRGLKKKMARSLEQIKDEILQLTREYSSQAHLFQRPGIDSLRPAFDSDRDTVPYAGRVFTEEEVVAAVGATLDFWLTLGAEGASFEKELSELMGVRNSLLVNSGSSANLVAISTITSPKLPLARRLLPGDEVITVAAGFPTTVAPIVQCGAVPVFIDADPSTGNASCDQLQAAYVPGKTKAVMMAHALGNPFDLAKVLRFCKDRDLWLIEDNCDALGCSYSMPVGLARELELKHLLKQAESGADSSHGDLGGPIDPIVLPTASFNDGRGWGCKYCPSSGFESDCGEFSGLGSGLLVSVGQGQHVQQAVWLAVG